MAWPGGRREEWPLSGRSMRKRALAGFAINSSKEQSVTLSCTHIHWAEIIFKNPPLNRKKADVGARCPQGLLGLQASQAAAPAKCYPSKLPPAPTQNLAGMSSLSGP